MAWMNITCKCKYTADFEDFCKTPVFGELPKGQYQCPKCGVAWKRQESEHRILRAGEASTIIAGRVELIQIDTRL